MSLGSSSNPLGCMPRSSLLSLGIGRTTADVIVVVCPVAITPIEQTKSNGIEGYFTNLASFHGLFQSPQVVR